MRKRAFDVIVICLAAVVWVPVVLVAALAVLVFSGRPIFYRSQRWVGPSRAIEMLKLRVMVPDANRVVAPIEAGRFLNTPPESPLYTPIGRILDRTGLNEIPQFLHVLRGEMSIVGSRPLTPAVKEALTQQHPDLDTRWETPAGLTGLPQLVGRGSLTDFERLHLSPYVPAVREYVGLAPAQVIAAASRRPAGVQLEVARASHRSAAAWTTSSVIGLGNSFLTSIPSSDMSVTTLGLISSAGSCGFVQLKRRAWYGQAASQ